MGTFVQKKTRTECDIITTIKINLKCKAKNDKIAKKEENYSIN
jgi:hypothetical protein